MPDKHDFITNENTVGKELSKIKDLSSKEETVYLSPDSLQLPDENIRKIIESKNFNNILDRKTVSQIFKTTNFNKYYPELLNKADIMQILKSHNEDVVEYFTELIKNNKLNENTKLKLLNSYLNNEGSKIKDYQSLVEHILETVNEGNLECDSRFLKMINHTIKKIGTYDDPALCKMTVQFVICKKYVEDFITIKKCLKSFSNCDL